MSPFTNSFWTAVLAASSMLISTHALPQNLPGMEEANALTIITVPQRNNLNVPQQSTDIQSNEQGCTPPPSTVSTWDALLLTRALNQGETICLYHDTDCQVSAGSITYDTKPDGEAEGDSLFDLPLARGWRFGIGPQGENMDCSP